MNRILSPDCYLGVVFTKPRGDAWKEARFILDEAAEFKHGAAFADELPGRIFIAGFDQKPLHAHTVHKLIILAGRWSKTAAFYLRGEKVNLKRLHWLKCFVQSRHANSLAAYCQGFVRMPPYLLSAADFEGMGELMIYGSGGSPGSIGIGVEDFDNYEAPSIKSTRGSWDGGVFHISSMKKNTSNDPDKCYILPCQKAFRPDPLFHYEILAVLKDQYQAWAVRNGVATCPNFDMSKFRILNPPEVKPSDAKE